MTDLDKLIEAVEGGVFHRNLDDLNNTGIFKDWNQCYTAGMAFNGSLDAAKALHEALLPGWKVAGLHQEDHGLWWAELREGWITSYSRAVVAPHSFDAPNPARAWMLAILKAYLAQQQE